MERSLYTEQELAMNRHARRVSAAALLLLVGLSVGLFAPASAWAATPKVAAGTYHTCALSSAGAVQCWGYNGYGELGNGTTTDSTTPVQVLGLTSGVTAIAAGGSHSCAVNGTGGVVCWGHNGNGELGNGTTTDSSAPVAVTGLASGIIAVASGYQHSCALSSTGAVQCWGFNGYGDLGNGTTTDLATPVAVSGLSGVVAIAAGDDHTCAVTSAGAVQCWGYNVEGELGNSATTTGSPYGTSVPVAATGLASGIASVAAGAAHSCALSGSGAVQCWGYNGEGELGNGTTVSASSPVAVSGLASAIASIAAGAGRTCAITTAGATQCWGYNLDGALGDGTTINASAPTPVAGVSSSVSAIAAGYDQTCVVTGAGGVQCWGLNASGQLGDGTTADAANPVEVLAMGGSGYLNLNGATLAAQTITFGALLTRALGSGSFNVGATATSGLAVSFSAPTSAVCTISGNSVTLMAAGTCTVGADQGGDGTYAAAPQVIQSFMVLASAAGRTFVSTAGSDTNGLIKCAPTSACRTFSAALGVTASGGEIVVLDSGGYGPPFSIAQSVSITAPDGVYAGVTVGTGAGITIATTGVSVALKGISINGTGGTYGISMTNGAALTVVNSVISGFSNSAGADAGIYVNTPSQVQLENVIVRDNFNGIYLDGGADATISQSQVLGNTGTGVAVANSGTGATSILHIDDSVTNGNAVGVAVSGSSPTATGIAYATRVVASGNGTYGFEAAANGTLVVDSSAAMKNGQYGFYNGGGTFDSAGNNMLSGNAVAATSGTIASGGLAY
jgi:alpha-tubulin suppressor-like RCC1 family protein